MGGRYIVVQPFEDLSGIDGFFLNIIVFQESFEKLQAEAVLIIIVPKDIRIGGAFDAQAA